MEQQYVAREALEASIATRIRRSKLLAKVLLPVTIAAGIAAGVAQSSSLRGVIFTVPALSGGALAVDGNRRKQFCDRAVERYASQFGVPSNMSRVAIGGLSSLDDGTVIPARVKFLKELRETNSHEVQVSFSGPASLGAMYFGCRRLVETYNDLSAYGTPPKLAVTHALLVGGVAGQAIRGVGLEAEISEYSRRLDNIEAAALMS